MDSTDVTKGQAAGIQPRRLPVQARSRERVERILDAAAQLLAEEGYNAVKTNAIAKRAGVSIGSVYQFFPNRFAIFNALADRYREKIADILRVHMSPEAAKQSWEEALEETMDLLAEMWRTDWAFHSVWLAIQNTAELRDASEHYRDALIADQLAGFLRQLMPQATRAEILSVGRVMLETSNLLLDLSMRNGPDQDELIIDELKFLLHNYIDAHVKAIKGEEATAES